MDIVLEGPDNAGKSTLAGFISTELNRITVHSEGREKYANEINERINRYFGLYHDVVYDRHPVVSQTIYHMIVENTEVDHELATRFYDSKPLIIYCRPDPERGMEGHITKEYDAPDYVQKIQDNFRQLVSVYDTWALKKANMIYRIGDDVPKLITAIKGLIA